MTLSYTVQIGVGGYAGWKVLERSMTRQKTAYAQSSQVKLVSKYFSDNASKIRDVDDLIGDQKIFSVVLTAFGLDSDIKNKYFIKKILTSDPDDKNSFVNRISDKKYLDMCKALAFPSSLDEGWKGLDIERILGKYVEKSFAKNVGLQHPEIEIVLNGRRELQDLVESSVTDNAKWYHIISSKSLRTVFAGAYGLTAGFSGLSVDRQLLELKRRTLKLTGADDVKQFESAESVDKLFDRYLIRSSVDLSGSSKYSAALTLIRGY